MALWFDRFGILFEFLGCWFMAPELIGQERMQRISRSLATFFATSLFTFLALAVLALAWAMVLREEVHWFHRVSIAFAISVVILVLKLAIFRKFQTHWLPSLIGHLSSDEHFRRGLLIVGGIFFSLGTLFQLIGTF